MNYWNVWIGVWLMSLVAWLIVVALSNPAARTKEDARGITETAFNLWIVTGIVLLGIKLIWFWK